jgi:hypothetical protein
MPNTEPSTEEDYDDHLKHLVRQPHDILVGWFVVGLLLVGIVLAALQRDSSGDPQGEASAGPEVAQPPEAASTPLAEQFGMSSLRAE